MSEAVKHNSKIPRLTYFVHSGDSIIQLIRVAVTKEETVKIIGYATELDDEKIKVYKSMVENPKMKIQDKEDKLNANQVHLFVNGYTNDNGKISINQLSTNQYKLYEGGLQRSKSKWIRPVVFGAIITGTVVVVVILINAISDAMFGDVM